MIKTLCYVNCWCIGADGELLVGYSENGKIDLVISELYEIEYLNGFYRVKTAFKSSEKRFKNKKLIRRKNRLN